MVRGFAARAGGCAVGLVAALGGFSACAEAPEISTEVLVVLRSDLVVPEQLDFVELRAVGPDGTEQYAAANLTAADGFPKSISLVHTGGATSPLWVSVSGRKGGNEVVRRSASLSFVLGRQLVLDLWLLSSCLEQVCAEGTCTEQGCASDAVDAHALPALQGTVASIEGQHVPPPVQWDAGGAVAPVDAMPLPGADASAEASTMEDAGTYDAGDGDGSLLEPPAGELDGEIPGAGWHDGGGATDGGWTGFSHDARVSMLGPTTDGCTSSRDCLTRCLLAPQRLKALVCSCALVCSSP